MVAVAVAGAVERGAINCLLELGLAIAVIRARFEFGGK